MADIFLSYSHKDRPLAENLANTLVLQGFSVWWDKHIGHGATYRAVIDSELNAAKTVLVLWSRDSIASDWVIDEAQLGNERGCLFPVRIADVDPPLGFRQKQTFDLVDWGGLPIDPRIDFLSQSIRAFLNQSPKLHSTRKDASSPIIRIASSPLYVVHAVTLAWGIEDMLGSLGLSTSTSSYPWNDSLLDRVADGSLDIAIYNSSRTRQYLASHPEAKLQIARAAGHSMGGRNFSILAHSASRWGFLAKADFGPALAGATVGAPKGSDMTEGFLALVGGEQGLQQHRIRLVDVPITTGVEFFELQPDGLLITGQNVRYASIYSGITREILSFDLLPDELKARFIASSANSIVVSEKARMEIANHREPDEFFQKAWETFIATWSRMPQFENQLERLTTDALSWNFPRDAIDYAARKILFETYRIGDPL